MKKLSEVCKIAGVTRRTLQEYDKIDLLKPTSKTEGGYWLYDNESIQKLIMIQIFVEAGYERKAIKELLDSDELDLEAEFDNVITILEEKRKRIDGMINLIENLKITFKLPLSTLRAMSNIDVAHMYREKSFSNLLDESIVSMSEYDAQDLEDANTYLPMWYAASAIGCLQGKPINSKPVRDCVEDFFRAFISLGIFEDDDEYERSLPEKAQIYIVALGLADEIDDLFGDDEIQQLLITQCGEGAFDFLKSAIKQYIVDQKNIEKEFGLEEYLYG